MGWILNNKQGHRGMKNVVATMIFSFLAALFTLSKYNSKPNLDSDILWSVAIGKWIDLHKSFPVVDSFSWTIYGNEWMTHEWAYSYLAYKLSDIFGNLGFYILTIIPILLTIYFLYLIARKYDIYNTYAYILILTLGIVFLYALALPFRAYSYALLFVTLLVYLLYFKKETYWDFLLYISLFILWANSQVSVFIGLVILTAELLRQFIIYPAKRIRVLLLGFTSIISVFINPYGYKLWFYFMFIMTNMSNHRNIAEWQAVDFNDPLNLLLYLGIAASVLLLQFNNMKKSASYLAEFNTDKELKVNGVSSIDNWNSLFDWVVKSFTRETCLLIGFWVFYIYALYSVRMMVFSLIFWIIVICYFVGKSKRFNFSYKTYYIFLLFFILMTFANLANADYRLKDIYTYDRDVSPVEEVAFLKDNQIYSQHLFNEYIFGGYLIINDIPVFIDARCDLYIKSGLLEKYIDIRDLNEDPQVLLNELEVKNLLIKEGPLKKYLDISPQWKIVYSGPTAFIYTRTAD